MRCPSKQFRVTVSCQISNQLSPSYEVFLHTCVTPLEYVAWASLPHVLWVHKSWICNLPFNYISNLWAAITFKVCSGRRPVLNVVVFIYEVEKDYFSKVLLNSKYLFSKNKHCQFVVISETHILQSKSHVMGKWIILCWISEPESVDSLIQPYVVKGNITSLVLWWITTPLWETTWTD